MPEQEKDIQILIRKELEKQNPSITSGLIKWLIGTFGLFILLLAFNAGIMYNRFSAIEDAMNENKVKINNINNDRVNRFEWAWNQYWTNYLWAERWGLPIPALPLSTRGDQTNK